MLSIISDIHLSDGTTAFNVHKDAFLEIYKNNVINSVKDNEVKELKLILLGDILDFVRTDYWIPLDRDEKPWNGKLAPETAMNNNTALMKQHYTKVLNNIFNDPYGSTQAFFDALNQIKDEIRNIPQFANLPIEIRYIIGNHDRILNVFPELTKMISDKLSSYNENEVIFENEFRGNDYTILCRHGHEYDENNYGKELYAYLNKLNSDKINRFEKYLYAVQSIGEVITAELMSGIVYRLGKNGVDQKFIDAVKDINNIRPMTDAFLWLYWYAGEVSNEKNKRELMSAFKKSIEAVIDSELGKAWDNLVREVWYFKGDITDRFEQLLDFIKKKSFDDVKNIIDFLKPVFSFVSGKSVDEYARGAKSAFASGALRDYQYIVMGHTHQALHEYLKGNVDGWVNMYINTGTYLPYIGKIQIGSQVSFSNANQMTLLNVFKKDEDRSNDKDNIYPTLDLWNGIKIKKYNL